MIPAAATHPAFTLVVVAVAVIGVAFALVQVLLRRDAFAPGRGGFWMFHGDADTSPHQMPGTRFEERHVIDPESTAGAPTTGTVGPTAPTEPGSVRRGGPGQRAAAR